MGLIKGQTDYQRWKNGVKLTRLESIYAQCYVCNGAKNEYCGGAKSCPLYQYSPFSHEAIKKSVLRRRESHDFGKIQRFKWDKTKMPLIEQG